MKIFKGTVTSAGKMSKTVVVEISRVVKHPIYQKRYKRSKKYLVHDELGTTKVDEKVSFVAVKPISKMKKWSLINVDKKIKNEAKKEAKK